MRFAGRVFKAGKHWVAEVPILGVCTRGRTRAEAREMLADAVESLVNRRGFTATVFEGKGGRVELGASDVAALTALLLRRERLRSGLSLAQVAERMGARSLNAYARYEQGRAAPTIRKLSELFAAVAPGGDFVLAPSDAGDGPAAA